MNTSTAKLSVLLLAGLLAVPAAAQDIAFTAGPRSFDTDAAPQIVGDTPATSQGWTPNPLWTVGETINGYTPPGIPDGIGAIREGGIVRLFVNHELQDSQGYAYDLANGLTLTGSRVSFFDVDPKTREIVDAGLAYDRVIDRYGNDVTAAQQINEGTNPIEGFDRLCSSGLFTAGEYGLVDNLYFTGEETGNGQEYALDVATRTLWTIPALGRAAWENVTLLGDDDPATTIVAVGDDRAGAPLLLFVGNKEESVAFSRYGERANVLERNGLDEGTLYVFAADDGALTPEDVNGTGTTFSGSFVAIPYFDPDQAGEPGYDLAGYADQSTQDAMAQAAGAFQFSRPEDVATDPADPSRFVMASTGRGGLFPSDNWGTTYIIDVDFSDLSAELEIIYDGDDAGNGQFAGPDFGLRSPDNLDWADDGLIYIQEDRSTSPDSLFGGTSGIEASLWQLDPADGSLTRIGEVDRSAIPEGQQENEEQTNEVGVTETSGVLDVTDLFPTEPGERLLVVDVQAHAIFGGPIEEGNLVQGGQLLFFSSGGEVAAEDMSAPECGAITPIFGGPNGELTALETTATDQESAIATVKFTLLNNVAGYANGEGPYPQGAVYFPPPNTHTVDIRGEVETLGASGAILVTVTNGAGLEAVCDPVFAQVGSAPEVTALDAAYPNPFSGQGNVTLPFRLAEAGDVRLSVYDLLGREVAVLVDERVEAGRYEATWEGHEADLASGTYVVRFTAGQQVMTKRLVVVR